MTGMARCSQPVGVFVKRNDTTHQEKFPAACNRWSCPECGPRKLKRFLYCLNSAAKTLTGEGYRFRGLTVTLGPNARNEEMGIYWHRFRMSLKKVGYNFEYLWVKEFHKNGKLHLHVLITAFIPWNVIRYYWRLATKGTSYIVWIAKAQVKHTAAYMVKYMSKDLVSAPFRKGERRYGMSKGIREVWPLIKPILDEKKNAEYEFIYMPDNRNILRKAVHEQHERKILREKWQSATSLRNNGDKRKDAIRKPKRKPKHNKSNLIKQYEVQK